MNRRRFVAIVVLAFALGAGAMAAACGSGGEAEQPGERITDPARVHTSTPVQNPSVYKILGNEVTLQGGGSGQVTPAPVNTPVSTDYIVKSGDLCSTIAASHNITLDQLTAANRNVDCNSLKIGDKLKIPGTSSATPTRGPLTSNPTTVSGGGKKTYTVKSGDTCAAIAQAQGVSLQALLAANKSIDANCTNLQAGQAITIP